MKLKIGILNFIFGVLVASAQVKPWNLHDCIAHALEHNITIKQFELDLIETGLDKSDAVGALLPNMEGIINASDAYGLNFDPTTNGVVVGKLRSGFGRLTSSVTLFDGLRNYNRIARARLNTITQRYRLDDLKDDIRLNVINAYLQVLSNKESLVALRAQHMSIQQEVNRTEKLVLSGVVAKGDLLDIEADAAGQKQQIAEAENLVLMSKLNLAQLLRINDYTNFDVKDEVTMNPSNTILTNTVKSIFYKAKEQRNDVKFSQLGIELARKDLKITQGAYYPTLTGNFEYETRYSALKIDTETNRKIGLFDQMYINDGIVYGAGIELPIFSRFSIRNGIKRAKIDVALANVEYKRTLLELEITINRAYVDVSNFFKAYEAAIKTLETRRLAHEYSTERFNVGLINAFDFSQSQSRVDVAEAQLIRAKYDYILRLKILEFYFGEPIG